MRDQTAHADTQRRTRPCDSSPPVSRGKVQRMMATTYRRGGGLSGVEVHVLTDKIGKAAKGEAEELLHLLEAL